MSSSPTDTATVEVTMPQMGVSVAEGTVVAWHKRPGDWVAAEETICEISTDKIDSELPAPAAGRVAEIVVGVDETVPVGTVLARIATDAVAGQAHPDEGAPGFNGGAGGDAPAQARDDARAEARDDAPAAQGNGRRAAGRHSPVVLRIAEREGVDLELVTGTGRGGRVRKQDVLAFVAARDEAGLADGADAGPQPPLHIESPYREEDAQAGLAGGSGASAPLSRMRRTIAEHMVRSLHTAATCTSIVEADMSRIEADRTRSGLSPLPYVARCVIGALREHPALNCTLEGDRLTRHDAVHLGLAVSLGDAGLIVPVIRDAHELSHEGLASRIRDLAARARSGALSPDDVRGGTFTITNPGGFGTIASTPIINQPQVAILDLEAIVRRPVVVSDGSGAEAIAIRPMVNLCLSWDHRALDGAAAAQFLSAVRRRIESWEA